MTSFSPNLVLKRSGSPRAYVPLKGKYQNGVIDDYLRDSYNFHDVRWCGVGMPRSGVIKDNNCGRWGVKCCFNTESHPDGKEYGKRFRMSCDRAECPECGDIWLFKSARRATEKIEACAKRYHQPVKHFVWSPNPNNVDVKTAGIKKLREMANNDLTAAGAFGFSLICHPWRDRMIGDKREWYFSPHFHAIGFGWIKVNKDFGTTRGVVKNLGVRESVMATFMYQLSHAGIKTGFHTVTWYGKMSYGKMSWYKPVLHPDLCPHCDKELVIGEFTVVFDPPPIEWQEGLLLKGSLCVLNGVNVN